MGEGIDIVIVSNANTSRLWGMTNQATKSAVNNAGVPAKVFVVEQCLWSSPQPKAKMLYYDFEFNYNRCLNLGFFASTAEYVAFCNNDLYFDRNWALNAIQAMKENNLLSCSPTHKHTFKGVLSGYTVGVHILGWCIIAHRSLFEKITKFAEVVKFWYSDNVYADQLKAAGIEHALIGNSKVIHYGSVSLKSLPFGKKRAEYMRGQKQLYANFKKKLYELKSSEIQAKEGNSN